MVMHCLENWHQGYGIPPSGVTGWMKIDEVNWMFTLVGISGFGSLQCFDTVGLAT